MSILNYISSMLIIEWSGGFLHEEIPVKKTSLLLAGLFVETPVCKSILGLVLLADI